jgi:hypothetical protein
MQAHKQESAQMKLSEIIFHRLLNQQIAQTRFKKPEGIVSALGALQAQEYAMSKWAIGLRLPGSTDAVIEKAFNEGKIIRTHLLRPTWHFVAPEDLRWMLELTAPRVHAINAFMYRKTGLDDRIFRRCHQIIRKELDGGKHLTRDTLNTALEKQKIVSDGVRLSCIMMHAELEGLICSGQRLGKQFTYALLEERIPPVKKIKKDEALHKLTDRYFRSRGPATLQDYVTWSGLTVRDARNGIGSLGKEFVHETISGNEYIFIPADIPDMKKMQTSFLMPDYDEYGMGYKDRSAIFNDAKYKAAVSRGNPVFNRMIILDGIIEGTWQRVVKGKNIGIEVAPFEKLSRAKQKTMDKAVERFRNFLG